MSHFLIKKLKKIEMKHSTFIVYNDYNESNPLKQVFFSFSDLDENNKHSGVLPEGLGGVGMGLGHGGAPLTQVQKLQNIFGQFD